jgi:hypothetical protein
VKKRLGWIWYVQRKENGIVDQIRINV